MIYPCYELLAKLRTMTLCGQNEGGELEWIGNDNDWRGLGVEEEAILRDFNGDTF